MKAGRACQHSTVCRRRCVRRVKSSIGSGWLTPYVHTSVLQCHFSHRNDTKRRCAQLLPRQKKRLSALYDHYAIDASVPKAGHTLAYHLACELIPHFDPMETPRPPLVCEGGQKASRKSTWTLSGPFSRYRNAGGFGHSSLPETFKTNPPMERYCA